VLFRSRQGSPMRPLGGGIRRQEERLLRGTLGRATRAKSASKPCCTPLCWPMLRWHGGFRGSMDKLACHDVSHSYDGRRPALERLELHVRGGEVLALLGPNGAGKSTTLRILATLQRPDRGEVLWDGQDVWAHRYDLRRRIGFLGDGTALYPEMTAGDYLAFFAECYGLDHGRRVARVEEVLSLFELS